MLGKGLESLIPPKGKQAGSAGASGALPPPPVHSALSSGEETSAGALPAGTHPQDAASVSPPPFMLEIESFEAAHPGEHFELVPKEDVSAPEPYAEEEKRYEEGAHPPRRGHRKERPIESIFYLEVEKVKPNSSQPRRNFDQSGLRDLASSIREFGILQPLVVTKKEKDVPTGTEVEYELIAGERRLMAAKLLGLERVPAIVRTVGLERERLELAIIENLQREDLNPIEMARAFARLQDEFRLTQREIAMRLGKSREVVANTLRLLDLPSDIQRNIEEGKMTESHGRLLLAIEDPSAREKLFRDLTERRMTTRELKSKVRSLALSGKAHSKSLSNISPEIAAFQERLSAELGAPVKIERQGESGKITISFYSEEELTSILDRIAGEET